MRRHGCVAAVWATLALMTLSAVCGAATDLSFNLKGYIWQIVNCAFTAGYSLTLRGAMDRVRSTPAESQPLSAAVHL